MRAQYHFRPSANGFYAWDVRKLVRLSVDLPVVSVQLADISELDELWWYQSGDDRPTPRSIAGHLQLVEAADLSYPILLCAEGRLMDGMHRCVKALAHGQSHIAARRFALTPPADYRDVQPDELAYD